MQGSNSNLPSEPSLSNQVLALQSHASQTKVSQLPPEIWLQIFLYVTWIPGVFEVSDHHAITAFTRDKHGITAHNRFRYTMDSKLSISLVCRSWHSLVRPTLFEYLLVKSGQQALRMAAALEDNKAMDLQGRGPGWWAIRLELALEGVHIWTNAHTSALASILRHCPNLVVFSTIFCTADAYLFQSSGFINAISGLSRLKRLEFKGDVSLLNTVMSLLALSLEVVWVVPPRRLHSSLKSWPLVLPKLHTLISGFAHASCLTELWEMPSLETLFMEDLVDLQHCSRNIGHNLRHVWVPNLGRVTPSLRLCPQLRELVVKFYRPCDVTGPLFGLFTHSSIRCIVIEDPQFIISDFGHVNVDTSDCSLWTALSSLISENRFPALNSIRFVLPLEYEASNGQSQFFLPSIWNRWMNLCHRQGIQIQISKGAEEWTANIWQRVSAGGIENKLYR